MKLDPRKVLTPTGTLMDWIDYEPLELPDGTTIIIHESVRDHVYAVNVKLKNGTEVSIEEYVLSMKWGKGDTSHVLPDDIPDDVLVKIFKNHAFELFFDQKLLEEGKYHLSELVVT